MLRTSPEEVWAIITKDLRGHSSANRKIAEDDEGNMIYIETTASGSSCVNLYVYNSEADDIIFNDIIMAHDDCIETIEKVYGLFFKDSDASSSVTAQYIEDEIRDRDEDLFEAASQFLDTILDGTCSPLSNCGELENELVELVAKWLQEKGIEVYHPMYLEDEESGEIEYTEYPYSQLV